MLFKLINFCGNVKVYPDGKDKNAVKIKAETLSKIQYLGFVFGVMQNLI